MIKKVGLFVMVYGILYKDEDIECYYIDICYGYKLSEEMIVDLCGRYYVIGGLFLFVKIIEV